MTVLRLRLRHRRRRARVSTRLSGATNVDVGCLGHSALRTDAGVFDRVRDVVC